nr:hypothetical protein [uncultured Lachnoclostridium sp.]
MFNLKSNSKVKGLGVLCMALAMLFNVSVAPVLAADGTVDTAGGVGAATITLTADQTLFGFSFPTDYPVHSLEDFKMVTASDLKYMNLSAAGGIKITGISLTTKADYVLGNFDADWKVEKVDAKKFSFMLNNSKVDPTTGLIDTTNEIDFPVIPAGGELAITYDAKVPPVSATVTSLAISDIYTTVDWDRAE